MNFRNRSVLVIAYKDISNCCINPLPFPMPFASLPLPNKPTQSPNSLLKKTKAINKTGSWASCMKWRIVQGGGEKASTLNMIRQSYQQQHTSARQHHSAVRVTCEVGQGRGGGVTSQRSRDRMPSRPGSADTSHLTSGHHLNSS